MKTRILALFVLGTMFLTTTVSAQNELGKNNFHRWNRERLDKDLKPQGEHENFFTDQQKSALKEMRLEMAKKVKPLRNKLGELQARQHTLTTEEKPDMDAIYKNIEKISDVKTEIAKIMAKHNQDIRAMLTEEQLLKYDVLKKRQLDYHENFGRRAGMDKIQKQRFEKS